MIRQEGKDKVITLKVAEPNEQDDGSACDDPEAIKLMVEFFYYLDYEADKNSNTPSTQKPDLYESDDSLPPDPRSRKRKSATKGRRSIKAAKLSLGKDTDGTKESEEHSWTGDTVAWQHMQKSSQQL